MRKRKDLFAVITILLLTVTTVVGILSMNFSHAYDYVNQYGQTVKLFGYGIYAFDTYLRAPVLIGSDVCILVVLIPLFIYTYYGYRKGSDAITELKLISVYGVALYYSSSIAFGVTYNRLFLVYLALFSCSLFGMFSHIKSLHFQSIIILTTGLKIFLVISGVSLIVAWLPDIIPTIITGNTLPLIGVYTTEITYVLDMGIISPLCFSILYLLSKKSPTGIIPLAIILKLCMIIGIMMLTQTICQIASKAELGIPLLITKSLSFVILSIFAFYFNRKMYKCLEGQD